MVPETRRESALPIAAVHPIATQFIELGIHLLFEPRGPAWTSEHVRPLVEDLDLVHVVDPLVGPTVSTHLLYYRLHGIGGARHVYSDDELGRLAAMVPADRGCYVMFNNMPRLGDAERFKLLLGARAASD